MAVAKRVIPSDGKCAAGFTEFVSEKQVVTQVHTIPFVGVLRITSDAKEFLCRRFRRRSGRIEAVIIRMLEGKCGCIKDRVHGIDLVFEPEDRSVSCRLNTRTSPAKALRVRPSALTLYTSDTP